MPDIRRGGLGVNGWVPSDHRRTPPPPRGAIKGWTEGAARRNRAFLRSVDPEPLHADLGYAVTLTLRDVPADAKAWAASINRFLVAMRQLGVIRYHWVTEWTKAGRPHLHGCLFWAGRPSFRMSADGRLSTDHEVLDGLFAQIVTGPDSGRQIEAQGIEDCEPIDWFFTDQAVAWVIFERWRRAVGSPISPRAQHVQRIRSIAGWAAYLAKHASRGVSHYQRQQSTLPSGWSSSGRLWAKGGSWPVIDERREIDWRSWYRFRRAARKAQIARAKAQIARARARHIEVRTEGQRAALARALAPHLAVLDHWRAFSKLDQDASRVRGFGGFISYSEQARLLRWAIDHPEGYEARPLR
jgi:hypothetical protein